MAQQTDDGKQFVSFLVALKHGSILGYAFVVLVFFLWYCFVAWPWKISVIFLAVCYHIGETLFSTFVDYSPDGSVIWRREPGLGHSTPEQFIINILFFPLIFFMRTLVPAWYLRVLIAPFFVWSLEILEGHLLIGIFGCNRAWQYRGPRSYFSGTIQLNFWWIWMIASIMCDLCFLLAIEPFIQNVHVFA